LHEQQLLSPGAVTAIPGRNQQGQEQNTVVFLKRLSGVDDMMAGRRTAPLRGRS
jgi:hypothetical protein